MNGKRMVGVFATVVAVLGGGYAGVHTLLRSPLWSPSNLPVASAANQPSNLSNTPLPTPSQAASAPSVPAVNEPVRGVIEGFYGTPWSNEQRVDMFHFMASHHFNTYIYAPKDDPYQRANWSALYPSSLAAQMENLVQAANQDGIRFVYSISPGIPQPLPGQSLTPQLVAQSITFTSVADRKKLDAKIDQLRGMGVHAFMLSFDDVEHVLKSQDQRVYGNDYVTAQVDLANKVWQDEHAKDPAFQLWFVPTQYYGTKDNHDWAVIRTRLSRAVDVIWTGSWVLNRTVTSEQAVMVSRLLGRPPLLWDNYPVNDYTYAVKKAPALLMGPLENRSPDLLGHLSGYMVNPMIQAEASKVPLATVGSYVGDPSSYTPTLAWQDAIRNMNGVTDPEAFLHFCQYSSESTLKPDGYSPFGALSSAYWAARTAEEKQQAEASMRQELEAVQALPGRLRATVTDQALLAEIDPWVSKLGQEAETALIALVYLDTPVSDPRHNQLRLDVSNRLKSLNGQSLNIGDDILSFINQAISR